MVILKRIAAPLALVLVMACAGPALAANDPSVHQVYEAAQSGHLDQALQMMNQVLRDNPGSAKAHYVEAELTARAGNFTRAREELATAQRLDPSGSFAQPQALAQLQRQLARGNSGYQTYRVEQRHSSFPWGIVLLVVAGVVIAWALFRRRNYYSVTQYPGGGVPPMGPGGGYGVPPGYGPAGYGPPMGGGMGSGIVGGLASGLAIGAGVAAGEELVRHFVDRDGNPVPAPPNYIPPPNDNPNMGGNDFGVSDSSSWGGDNSDSSWGGDSGGSDGGGDWT